MIATVGDLVEDLICLVAGPPRRGTDVPASVSRHRGGSAANVAAVAARLTGRARFIGRVGSDEAGDHLVARLQRLGVEVAGERVGRTGAIVALVDPAGEKAMLTDRGSSPDLDACDPSWLEDAAVLHIPAYSLATGCLAKAARELAAHARQRGVPVSIDASSVAVLEIAGPGVVAGADVVLANAEEAALLGEVSVPLLVVKDGPRPAVVHQRGEAPVAVPVPAVAGVVDTTGAGDAFAAGFLVAWSQVADPIAATMAGHTAARHVITGPGADHWDGEQ